MPYDMTGLDHEATQAEDRSDAYESRERRWLYLFAAVLVAVWGSNVAIFGLPGLFLTALALVPVMMLILVWLTRG